MLLLLLLALVLRGLDILSSKETIEGILIELTSVQMKNCAIVKENHTGVSRGFAFVEYTSIHVRRRTAAALVYERLFCPFLGFSPSLRKTTKHHTWH